LGRNEKGGDKMNKRDWPKLMYLIEEGEGDDAFTNTSDKIENLMGVGDSNIVAVYEFKEMLQADSVTKVVTKKLPKEIEKIIKKKAKEQES
jgi:hypothetical protein